MSLEFAQMMYAGQTQLCDTLCLGHVDLTLEVNKTALARRQTGPQVRLTHT
jgi:hypothetical protein